MTQLAACPAHVPLELVMDIDVYDPPGVSEDVHLGWKRLHDAGAPDVIWTPRNGGHWIATRAAPMREIYQDYHRFSSRVGLVPKGQGASEFIPASLDPPRHRSYRTLLNGSFAPKVIRHSRERVREVAGDLIDALKDRGWCEFQQDYANQLPVRVFMEMMDLPLEDAVKVKYWSDQITRQLGDMTHHEAEELFYAYLDPYIRARMGAAGEDVISRLVNSEVEGAPMTIGQAKPLTAQVLQGGVETVINFLGFIIVHLARHPEHRRELIERPERMTPALDEFFRRFGIVINTREVAQDTQLAGAPLKAGDAIVMPNMLAGLDEREHPDPLTVDFDRPDKSQMTFGAGSHRCPGSPLARIETEITIEEWLKRIPDFELGPDFGPRYRSGVTPEVDRISLVWAV